MVEGTAADIDHNRPSHLPADKDSIPVYPYDAGSKAIAQALRAVEMPRGKRSGPAGCHILWVPTVSGKPVPSHAAGRPPLGHQPFTPTHPPSRP